MGSAQKSTIKTFAKELSTLHLALTAGAGGILVLIYFTAMDAPRFDIEGADKMYLYLCLILAINGIFMGNFMFNKKLRGIDSTDSLDHRLMEYRAARIMQYALAEGAALVSIVLGMQENNLVYLTIAMVMIIYLFSLRITTLKISNDLNLDM